MSNTTILRNTNKNKQNKQNLLVVKGVGITPKTHDTWPDA
jgi:hypothetical protein